MFACDVCGIEKPTYKAKRSHETAAHGDRRTVRLMTVDELIAELQGRLPVGVTVTVTGMGTIEPVRIRTVYKKEDG